MLLPGACDSDSDVCLSEIFGRDTGAELHKIVLLQESSDFRAFVLGELVFALAAARRPEFWRHDARLATFAESLPDRCALAAAGFFSESDGRAGARCFHCGRSGIDCRRQGGCELRRLLDAVGSSSSSCGSCSSSRCSSGADWKLTGVKLRRAVHQLRLLLRRPLLRFVQSFGFSRSAVAFGAARCFFANAGRLPGAPGDIVDAVHRCADSFGQKFIDSFDVERLAGGLGEESDSRHGNQDSRNSNQDTSRHSNQDTSPHSNQESLHSNQDTSRHSNQDTSCHSNQESHHGSQDSHDTSRHGNQDTSLHSNQNHEKLKHQDASRHGNEAKAKESSGNNSGSSDRCVACRLRVRDHMTLPCAHFLLCGSCLATASRCPACDSGIRGWLKTFIA